MSQASPAGGGRGMFPTGRRRSVLRTFILLYEVEVAFRGLVDFAVIGALVLLFLHPPSAADFRWLTSHLEKSQPAAGSPAGSGPAPQVGIPAAKPSPAAPDIAKVAPAKSLPSAPSAPAEATKPAIPIPFTPEIAKPALQNTMLVELPENMFRNSSAQDQQRLLLARSAFRSGRHADIVNILGDADVRDPNVAFMRAIGLLSRNEPASNKTAEDLLRAASQAGLVAARTVLGRLLVVPPKGVEKNVDEGKALLDAAAATGDPQAQRVAAIGYMNADFGVFDPAKAARYFKAAADAGDPQAMFHYARVVSEGLAGIRADEAEAETYLGRAAGAGLTNAQYTLGSWLLKRYQAEQLPDPSVGVIWLELAFEKGFLLAAYVDMAWLYRANGRSSPWNDKNRFFAVARRCADIATWLCHEQIGEAYLQGWGTAKDTQLAYVHRMIARDLGWPTGTKAIDELSTLLTSNERAQATEQARTIRQKLKPIPSPVVFQYPDVVRPSPWTQSQAATALVSAPAPASPASPRAGVAPEGVPIPFYDYLKKPAAFYPYLLDLRPSSLRLGNDETGAVVRKAIALYHERNFSAVIETLKNVETDPNAAMLMAVALWMQGGSRDPAVGSRIEALLRKAAAMENQTATAVLAHFLAVPTAGMVRNATESRALFERAIATGNSYAMRQYAIEWMAGSLGTSDPQRAAELMKSSADAGDPVASTMMAAFYQEGIGFTADAENAQIYLRRAARQGFTTAQILLAQWRIDIYRKNAASTPEEAVQWLERAASAGRSHEANWLLAALYSDYGQAPPWKDRLRGLEYVKRCIAYSYPSCHFGYAALLTGGGGIRVDRIDAWAHYDVARSLGNTKAAERLEQIERDMPAQDVGVARDLSRALQRDLRPLPAVKFLQND